MASGIATVKFNERQLRKIREQLETAGSKRAIGKVMSRAINKTVMSARTKASREISGKVKLPVGVVRKSISLERAKYKVWQATLGVGGKRVPLIRFGGRQTKKGISYQIDRSTGRKKIAHAFINTVSSGHKGAFARRDEKRYPIDQLYGPSIGRIFAGSRKIIRRVTKEASKNLRKNIDYQVGLILGRLKERGA